ncbi:hypothetical protein WME82_04325 [Sorangium sp. So ce128]
MVAWSRGQDDPAAETLFSTLTNVSFDPEALLELCLECGQVNLLVMRMLDEGHRVRFGEPQPAMVREGTVAGPGILVSGHDLSDLAELLRQCEGTGVRVYTHGEMLPAHAYPELASPPLPDHFVRETEVGYHHEAILAHAGAIVEAVKAGKISRFFLIGGCDGPEAARSYFTDYAAQTPRDSFILTLGCGKYRIRNQDHGTHLGLPRLLQQRYDLRLTGRAPSMDLLQLHRAPASA